MCGLRKALKSCQNYALTDHGGFFYITDEFMARTAIGKPNWPNSRGS